MIGWLTVSVPRTIAKDKPIAEKSTMRNLDLAGPQKHRYVPMYQLKLVIL